MSLTELDIIARYFAHHDRGAGVLLGVGDDAAVLDGRRGRKLVVAVDTIVEGVHFPSGTDAADVGYRALAVNLSDLAAMGAEPAWMTLSLSIPQATEAWLAGFAAGLFELADRYNVALVGGDTVRGPLVITVQAGGWVESDRWLTRSGAKPGDLLLISGVTGEAAAGLALLQRQVSPDKPAHTKVAWEAHDNPPSQPEVASVESAAHLRRRFLRPEPRIGLGRQLRPIASAAMDVSDGLLTDLGKLCTASGCGVQLNVDAVPVSMQMRELLDADTCVNYALAGGDDYEILFTIAPDRAPALVARLDPQPPVARIGVITPGSGVQCIRGGRPFTMRRGGYDHFAPVVDDGYGAPDGKPQ